MRRALGLCVAFTVVLLAGCGRPGRELPRRGPPPRAAAEAPPPLPRVAHQWRAAGEDHRWSFPRDHWSHPGYKTEWWYLTGALRAVDDPSRELGYQFTLFRVGVAPTLPAGTSSWRVTDLVMGHASMVDLATQRHRFAEVLHRATPLLGGFPPPPTGVSAAPPGGGDPDQDPATLAWCRGPAGTAAPWAIRFVDGGFDLEAHDAAQGLSWSLRTRPARPRIFQGPGGVSRKGEVEGQASLYYSYTRLETRGHLVVDGERVEVEGTSWMDKEFGSNQLGAQQVGWDWFSLRLADGRDLMLYSLRRADGTTDHASGTLVGAGGAVEFLAGPDFQVEATGTWTSPETRATYPSGWVLRLPGQGLALRVTPRMAAQENISTRVPGQFYWEGRVAVEGLDGAPDGEGYVELTGYGEGRRLEL